jgi:hypothetical protein
MTLPQCLLKERFPFLQPMYSKKWGKDTWVNTCIHCQTIQGDDYNIHTWGSPFGGDMGKLLEFKKTEVLQLRFDYYIDSAIYEGEYHYDSSEEEDE